MINWSFDYAWGLPLIVFTVVIHSYGLQFIYKVVTSMLKGSGRFGNLSATSSFVMGRTALWVTILHGFDSCIWALAYRFLGALQDYKSAMLYSLNAMTSYGHENLTLAPRWEMMGALEALDGWILFGLTTAFPFSVMQRAWPHVYDKQQ